MLVAVQFMHLWRKKYLASLYSKDRCRLTSFPKCPTQRQVDLNLSSPIQWKEDFTQIGWSCQAKFICLKLIMKSRIEIDNHRYTMLFDAVADPGGTNPRRSLFYSQLSEKLHEIKEICIPRRAPQEPSFHPPLHYASVNVW